MVRWVERSFGMTSSALFMGLREANTWGGVLGAEEGNEASDDDGDREGVCTDDEEDELQTDGDGSASNLWSLCQGEPCSS